jgi:hypothetical protein
MNTLKDELNIYKDKLFQIEKQLQLETSKVAEKVKIWENEEASLNNIIKEKGNQIIKFNVSGKCFKTKLSTLANLKETLFYKMILSSTNELNNTLYFDRDHFYFEIILNFLRYKTIDYSRFNHVEKRLLLIEAEYFEIKELADHLNGHLFDVELVTFEFSMVLIYIKGKKQEQILLMILVTKVL